MEKISLLADFKRYADLIETSMRSTPAQVPVGHSGIATSVEFGNLFPKAMIDPTPPSNDTAPIASAAQMVALPIIDMDGHQRPAYRGLLVYSLLRTFGLFYETLPRSEFGRWEEALRVWADHLESELLNIKWPAQLHAADGSLAARAAWSALALHVAGKLFIRDAWTDLAAETFGRLEKHQTEAGGFLIATASDNIETLGYDELALLHAAASYAVQAEDRSLAAAVLKATEHFQATAQPDHSTTQPWALFAFIWNASTRITADQMLDTARVSYPTEFDGISWMLLADALYCLRLFLPKEKR